MKYLFVLLVCFGAFAQEDEQNTETEAQRAMRLSCEKHKVGLGCFNYANMMLRLEKSDEAEKYFEIGCKLEHAPSCQKEKWDLPSTASSSPAQAASPASSDEAEPETTESTQQAESSSKE